MGCRLHTQFSEKIFRRQRFQQDGIAIPGEGQTQNPAIVQNPVLYTEDPIIRKKARAELTSVIIMQSHWIKRQARTLASAVFLMFEGKKSRRIWSTIDTRP
jgi:hypothetical protein